MKRFDTRRLWAALALALILCLAVPALLPARIAPAAQAAGRVKLSKAKATLYVGQTLQLKLNNVSGKVAWKSSKKGVAAVTGKGKVTAKKKGTATVTATCGGKKYTCKVTVKPGLTMSSTDVSVPAQGKATFKLNQRVDGRVTAESDDDNVAYATVKGGKKKGEKTLTVWGEEAGSAVITLKNAATKEKLKLKVTVSKPKPTAAPAPTATPAPKSRLVLENAGDSNITLHYNPMRGGYPPYSMGIFLYNDDERDVEYSIEDESMVKCDWYFKWGFFKEDYRILQISPYYKEGTTTITLTNNASSETITIHVTVVIDWDFQGY